MKKPAKIRKIPGLIIYFPSGFRYARNEIANRLDISERLVYRYLEDLKDVAFFIIPPPKDGRYCIDKHTPYFKEISELLHFSEEETILQHAIHAIIDENLLKRKLVKTRSSGGFCERQE